MHYFVEVAKRGGSEGKKRRNFLTSTIYWHAQSSAYAVNDHYSKIMSSASSSDPSSCPGGGGGGDEPLAPLGGIIVDGGNTATETVSATSPQDGVSTIVVPGTPPSASGGGNIMTTTTTLTPDVARVNLADGTVFSFTTSLVEAVASSSAVGILSPALLRGTSNVSTSESVTSSTTVGGMLRPVAASTNRGEGRPYDHTQVVPSSGMLSMSLPNNYVISAVAAGGAVSDNATAPPPYPQHQQLNQDRHPPPPHSAQQQLQQMMQLPIHCLNPATEINSRLDTQVEVRVYPCNNNNGAAAAPAQKKKFTQFHVKPEGVIIQGSTNRRSQTSGGSGMNPIDLGTEYAMHVGRKLQRYELSDTRACQLLVTTHNKSFWVVPAPEAFSRHSGTCRLLGDRKHPPASHGLQVGDFLRVGSVGVVVIETHDGRENRVLSEKKIQKIMKDTTNSAGGFDLADTDGGKFSCCFE